MSRPSSKVASGQSSFAYTLSPNRSRSVSVSLAVVTRATWSPDNRTTFLRLGRLISDLARVFVYAWWSRDRIYSGLLLRFPSDDYADHNLTSYRVSPINAFILICCCWPRRNPPSSSSLNKKLTRGPPPEVADLPLYHHLHSASHSRVYWCE